VRRGGIALCLPIIGCLNGDFGRVRPSLVDPHFAPSVHSWLGREAAAQYGIPPSEFRLTDEEILLRDLAYPLIEAPYDRQQWYSVLAEYGLIQYFREDWYTFDPADYAEVLLTSDTRSTSTYYARLTDDIRNDIVRIPAFVDSARKVVDLDRKREKSLAYVSVLSPEEVADVRRRIAENVLVIGWVHRSLLDRCKSYRFALERLVISAPSQMAVEAERQLTLLSQRITQAKLVPPPVAVVSK
jgi:hypothetical protein